MNPMVQNFYLSFKEKETYLGAIFSEMGVVDSISKTIEARKIKCFIRANEIRKDLGDERLQGVGWLAAAVLLHNAVVISTLSYAAAAFINLSKQQEESLEYTQRKCLVNILDISKTSTYKSLLFILGILPMSTLVKKLKICFLNSLFHLKESGECLDTIKADHLVGDVRGIIDEVQEYCKEFELPDVTEHFVEPDVIKEKIKRKAMGELWQAHIFAKKPPITNIREDCKSRFYFELPKNKAKLMLCYEIGELNFRVNRKNEAKKKYGGTQCLVKGCVEEDSWQHVQECHGYTSRLKKGWGPYDLINYMVELENERNRKHNRSLINFRSF